MAAQARSGVDCLLWLSVQVGQYRQAAHIRVLDHRSGLDISISRFAQQDVSHADVSLDRPIRILAQQFLGRRDNDELRLRQSIEVPGAW
jgi:hypothetical protein